MANKIRIVAKKKGGKATVKCRIRHPMETGLRKGPKAGIVIPAHYITDVICKLNGSNIMMAYFGPAVSKDPYLSFDILDISEGDIVTIKWIDNKGQSASADAEII